VVFALKFVHKLSETICGNCEPRWVSTTQYIFSTEREKCQFIMHLSKHRKLLLGKVRIIIIRGVKMEKTYTAYLRGCHILFGILNNRKYQRSIPVTICGFILNCSEKNCEYSQLCPLMSLSLHWRRCKWSSTSRISKISFHKGQLKA
jgi:hypothetical protein